MFCSDICISLSFNSRYPPHVFLGIIPGMDDDDDDDDDELYTARLLLCAIISNFRGFVQCQEILGKMILTIPL